MLQGIGGDAGGQTGAAARWPYRATVGCVIVNVCPAAFTPASPDQIWSVLTTPELFGEWTDAAYVGSEPPGPVKKGQNIHLAAPSFGRRWPIDIEVRNIDPQRRWIDFLVRLPFGIENHEHVTLTEIESGTLVRFT